MDYLNHEIERELEEAGADFVHFLDVLALPVAQNRGLPRAILIGVAISPHYIVKVLADPDYVLTHEDEYVQTEHRAGVITDKLAGYLTDKGYKAISQSDSGLIAEGAFNFETKESVLPHKTVAQLSGAGWIGKNNLFITSRYGAAQCLGTILTDAPFETTRQELRVPKCGNCSVCADICEKRVLKKKTWAPYVLRDEIVDVYGCSVCTKCLAHCPWTQAYVRKHINYAVKRQR